MKSNKKNIDDLQTEVNSPPKRIRFSLKTDNEIGRVLNFEKVTNQPKSLTEQQLFSRSLVREIVHKEKNKIIKHQIGVIDKSSSLYAKPRNFNPCQFKFDNIPPQNQNYSSLASAKIHEIYKGLRSQSTMSQLKSQKSYTLKNENKTKIDSRKQSLAINKQVSVSGMATYKFFSAKAQQSIAFNRINYEQKLRIEIQNVRKQRDCPQNRLKKIFFKKSSEHLVENSRKQSKIVSNFEEKTDDYLKNMITENEQERLLYGQKSQKLEFIRDYMNLQHTSYEAGRHIIDQIQNCRTQKGEKVEQKKIIKTEPNQELQFEKRRIPKAKNKLKVKQLTFVQ